jgi:antitoxin (DNA-binding transcriptional repressor) of toxin-antitoxin stability system
MKLSRHLKRVRAGARLVVTERGRSIATINPMDTPADVNWAHQLVAEGHARWNGGKPTGATRPPSKRPASKRPTRLTGRTASSIVIEDCR